MRKRVAIFVVCMVMGFTLCLLFFLKNQVLFIDCLGGTFIDDAGMITGSSEPVVILEECLHYKEVSVVLEGAVSVAFFSSLKGFVYMDSGKEATMDDICCFMITGEPVEGTVNGRVRIRHDDCETSYRICLIGKYVIVTRKLFI